MEDSTPLYRLEPMARKAEQRLTIPAIGEWYADLLVIDSAINARTPGQQASSLLCAKLQEREAKIRERVAYFASKRGLTPEEMWKALATGNYEPITPEEWAKMPQDPDQHPDNEGNEGSDRPVK